MDLLQRLKYSLRKQGPGATFTKVWALAIDYLFDFRYGTDTCACMQLDELTIKGENKEKGFRYQPTRVVPLRKLFRVLRPTIPAGSVLVDLGCGKGRILLVASEFGFKEVRGVEFARELCETARKNSVAFKARTGIKTECQIIEDDVTHYTIHDDENVFFLYNPFDETILSKVLCNITTSLQAHPRKILILYSNPTCARAIEQRDDFVRSHTLNLCGCDFIVYSNRAEKHSPK
jgi:SAM-dependent methyltransferase